MSQENNDFNDSTQPKKELIIPPLGFQNTGAICYFNSLLQCLLSSTNFLRFILSDSKNDQFLTFFKSITNDLWNSRFSTELLQSVGTFQPNQSSSEYFLMTMDKLKWERLFECKHKLIKVCKACGHKNEKSDISYNVLIDNSFDEFMKSECDLENVLCDGCKVKTLYHQEQHIQTLSPVIVMSLNKYFGKKMIEYPPVMRFGDKATYAMIGTIEHIGGLNGGHYIARVRRTETGEDGQKIPSYYIMDDMKVIPIAQDVFYKSVTETYMVFYDRIQ